jgi:hypothetical protein
MKDFFQGFGTKRFLHGVALILLAGMCGASEVYGDTAGLTVEISLKQAPADSRFPLGVPVGLTMVLRNATDWSIYTEKGFSQVELHQSLVLTDPNQKVHSFIDPKAVVDTMPPPIFWNDRAVLFAERVSPGIVRSTTISDLRTLFPVMNSLSGWYTIEAHQPFIRFASWIETRALGILGVGDDRNNWHGTVDSNKIQFYLYPYAGAQIKLQVLDKSVDPSEPLFQVPVKVFRKSEVPAAFTLEDSWTKVQPALTGSTNTEGFAVWATEGPCMVNDDYTIVAKYGGEYQSESVVKDTEPGWAPGCTGSIAKSLTFGEAPQPPPPIKGDLNGDRCVDLTDYNILMTDIRNGEPNNPSYDLNGDGLVNRADARTLIGLFTNPGGAPCK